MSHTETEKAKFHPGQIIATPGVLEALQNAGQQPQEFLMRHLSSDWGDLDDEDRQLNDAALIDGSRILSAYSTAKNSAFGSSRRRLVTKGDEHRVAYCYPRNTERQPLTHPVPNCYLWDGREIKQQQAWSP